MPFHARIEPNGIGAIPRFKLGEIEKGKGLLGGVVELSDGGGSAVRLHACQQVD
jgi:hypothetical protein